MIPTFVIDNFFEAPDLWRKYAIEQKFYKGDRGNWPGERTELLSVLNKDLFDTVENKLLDYFPQFVKFSESDITFQIIGEDYGQGWIHTDDIEHDVAGFVYLSPNSPQNTGSTIYNDQHDWNAEKFTKLFLDDVNNEIRTTDKVMHKYRQEQRQKFTPSITIENQYNRCIMFDPSKWHSANNFFGDTLDNSRLTLVFFCNGVKVNA